MPTLSDLRHMRQQGKAPALPVVVTANRCLARNLESIGAIVLRPLSDADWRPLSGLEVLLDGVPRDVALAIRAVRPRRLRAIHEQLSVIL